MQCDAICNVMRLTWTEKLSVVSLIQHTQPETNIKTMETKTKQINASGH